MRKGGHDVAIPPQRASSSPIYFFGALEGLVFGYDTGVIAGALLFLRRDMALGPASQGLVVGSLLVGSVVAAPVAGLLSDRFGARRMIGTAGLLFLIGSIGCALAANASGLVVFRFVLGLGVGVGTVQVPVYLAELAPARSRGRLTSLFQLMTASGIFLAYVVGYALAASGAWRAMFGIAAVPALLLIAGAVLLPESPRWLIKQGRQQDALTVLRRTRTADEAVREHGEIVATALRPARSLRLLLADPWIRRMFAIALVMCVFQQAIGINTIVYYSPTIIEAAGLRDSSAILAGAGLQALSIAMTVLLGRIVDATGRRVLLILGALAMAASMAALGTIFALDRLDAHPGAALACLAVFKAAFSLSWGPVLWIVLPELLPLHARGRTMGMCVLVTYVANFIVSALFPILLASGPALVFASFAASAILAALFVRVALPETARTSLEQIETGAAAA